MVGRGGCADAPLTAPSHARLTPSPHDLQPRKAERVGPDGVRVWRDPALVAALRDLTGKAHRIEDCTPPANRESMALMRIGRAEIEASPDGINLGGPVLEALLLAGRMTREALHPVSRALQEHPGMALGNALLAPEGGAVQMLGRLGDGPGTAPSPRWPLHARLRHV